MNLRPFEDLIKWIEYDGKTVVPIEEIAKLAVNDMDIFVKNTIAKILKRKLDYYQVDILIKNMKDMEDVNVTIYKDFRVCLIVGKDIISHFCQVQIVKNLIKWGFVEP